LPLSEKYEAAIFHLYMDQPIYVNGEISVHDVARFMTLRKEYRQVLYGAVRMECGESDKDKLTYESFPPQHTKKELESLGFAARFPAYLIPLPQASYSSFQWINILSKPEHERLNSTTATNVVTYMLLLRVTHTRKQSANQIASDSQHDPRVSVDANSDGSLSRIFQIVDREQLPKCTLSVLTDSQQVGWNPQVSLTNFIGDRVVGTAQLRRSQSPLRYYHAVWDSGTLEDFSQGAQNAPGPSEHSTASTTQSDATNQNDDTHVFLAEELHVQTRVKNALGIILSPILDKLMQTSYPILERMNEYVIPGLSKGLILKFAGKGAPGSNPPTSAAYPGFLEMEQLLEHSSRQQYEDQLDGELHSSMVHKIHKHVNKNDVKKEHVSAAVQASSDSGVTLHHEMLKRKYETWRAHVQEHPEEYMYHGAYQPLDEKFEFSRERFEEVRLDALHREAQASQEFNALDAERARARARISHGTDGSEAIVERMNKMMSSVPSEVTPGEMPQKLIDAMSPSLTSSLSQTITDDMSDAVQEEVHDFEIHDMREWLAEGVTDGLKSILETTLTTTLPETVPGMLKQFLPKMLKESTDWTLTGTLSRGLTHSLSGPLAMALARPPEEEVMCSRCYYEKANCDMCSWTITKKAVLLENVDYLGDYYSDQFADHFTGVKDAVGFPQGSAAPHAPAFVQLVEEVDITPSKR
jgi:hypothetical protein